MISFFNLSLVVYGAAYGATVYGAIFLANCLDGTVNSS